MTHKHDYLKDSIIILAVILMVMAAFPSFAGSVASSPLPASTPLQIMRDFFSGTFAWTVSIISMVVSGSMLAFGGADFGGAARSFLVLALVLSFVVFANNTYSTWFAGAVI
jgi:type IV secretory pathway VirB2 component (pilin)